MININKHNLSKVLEEFQSGKQSSALKKIQVYLKHNIDDYKVRYNYAVMLEQNGQKDKAISNYNEVLKYDKNHWRALTNLYLIYFHEEKYKESLNLVNKILYTNPDHQPSLRDKGHILFYLEELDEARKNVEKSIKINSKDYIALNILGMILDKQGLFEDAIKIYKHTININKEYYPSYSNLGKTYMELKEPENAIEVLKEGLNINPNFIYAQNNLANVYHQTGFYDDAIKIYKNILEKEPNHKDVNSNLAISYYYKNDFENTDKYFNITKKIHPSDPTFQKNYAHYLLFKQQYKEAWESYWDSRLKVDEYYISSEWKFKIRPHIYIGKKISKNENILIIKEQGIGDEILYSTMYPELINDFPNCIIETEERLLNLFKRSYKAVNNFVPFLSISNSKESLSKFDKVICAGSLGKFYRNNLSDFPKKNKLIPNTKEYEELKKFLNSKNKNKKIGISWLSKRKFFGGGKSIDLCDLQSIIKNKEIEFIDLQYGDTAEDINNLKNKHNLEITKIPNLDLMNDFEKISALLVNLDLFVTVSNSTAHLAGALNVPTVLIKPKSYALFHYWSQPNDTTPWYPSIKMIEQENNKDEFIKKLEKIIFEELDKN